MGQKPTAEQLKEVEMAKMFPIEFDEDCPEMMKAFKCAVAQRNQRKRRDCMYEPHLKQ